MHQFLFYINYIIKYFPHLVPIPWPFVPIRAINDLKPSGVNHYKTIITMMYWDIIQNEIMSKLNVDYLERQLPDVPFLHTEKFLLSVSAYLFASKLENITQYGYWISQ